MASDVSKMSEAEKKAERDAWAKADREEEARLAAEFEAQENAREEARREEELAAQFERENPSFGTQLEGTLSDAAEYGQELGKEILTSEPVQWLASKASWADRKTREKLAKMAGMDKKIVKKLGEGVPSSQILGEDYGVPEGKSLSDVSLGYALTGGPATDIASYGVKKLADMAFPGIEKKMSAAEKKLRDWGPTIGDLAYSDTGKEWFKLQKGGWADPTARGAVGLGLDMVAPSSLLAALKPGVVMGTAAKTFPKTAAALKTATSTRAFENPWLNLPVATAQLATKAIPYATRATIAPLDTLGTSAAKGIYSNALRFLNREGSLANRKLIGDILWEANQWGGSEAMNEAVDQIQKKAGLTMGEIQEIADQAGLKINVQRPLMAGYEHGVQMGRSVEPGIRAEAKKLGETLGSIGEAVEGKSKAAGLGMDELPFSEGQKASQDIGSNLDWRDPNSSRYNLAMVDTKQKWAEELDKVLESHNPALAKKWKEAKEIYGSTKIVDDALLSEIRKELGKAGMTQVDTALLASMLHSPLQAGTALGGKNLGRLLNSMVGGTTIGIMGKKAAPFSELFLKKPAVWEGLYTPIEGEER